MLVEIPPKMSIAEFVGYLKGKSSLIIHQRHGNLKYSTGIEVFGAEAITWIQQERIQSE